MLSVVKLLATLLPILVKQREVFCGLPASESVCLYCMCAKLCGCEHDGGRKKAATRSRPNAQVKTTDECCCRVFPIKLLLLLWKMKTFPFQQFVSFLNVGEN